MKKTPEFALEKSSNHWNFLRSKVPTIGSFFRKVPTIGTFKLEKFQSLELLQNAENKHISGSMSMLKLGVSHFGAQDLLLRDSVVMSFTDFRIKCI